MQLKCFPADDASSCLLRYAFRVKPFRHTSHLYGFFGDAWQGFISDGMRLINFGIGHSTSVVVVLVVHVVVDRLVCVHCHFDFYFG